ncbi:hypothetical protein DYU11_02730 [Fibrisoma montanum]|uniref:Right handed beta helix domain-containing protein n=1 Tax=Fibrisoma montanum TaxID=2305895 RepID=A0A418MIH0_9BACT|nr:right-handed parallel beta-helix repeat-containing protein [Fibrisoma montanum]RIV27245.1 hypothetical protein DYU11_02730 [Fibrisoma montanum]
MKGHIGWMGTWLLGAGWAVSAQAQSTKCPCDYLIKTSGTYYAKQVNAPAGSTICIQAGQYETLKFYNFAGEAGKPLTFINYGGPVVIKSTGKESALDFYNCRNIKVSGGGKPGLQYGITAQTTFQDVSAMHIHDKSTDVEVEFVEIAGAGFAGIMAKTDPSCSDSTAWRSNFTMTNVHIHDNYIHDVKGEGMYIGNSFWGTGQERTCNGVKVRLFPHNITNLHIHHNRVERTGAEGIQIGCAPDFNVHHNVVRSTGIAPFTPDQDNGIQIGGGADGQLHHNYLEDAHDIGLIIVGHLGDVTVSNNVVINSGGVAVFCDERTGSLPNRAIRFINNTFVNSGEDGFRLYNETQKNILVNNVIANINTLNSRSPYKAVSFGQNATAEQTGNTITQDVTTLRFADFAKGDFKLLKDSPLIDKGVDVSSMGVVSDLADRLRPQGVGYDVGAYEFGELLAPAVPGAEGCETTLTRIGYVTLQPGVQAPPLPPVEVITGVEESVVPIELALSPVPCPDRLQITVETGVEIRRVAIYSLAGQEVNQWRFAAREATGRCEITVTPYASGLYTIRVTTSAGTGTGRFLKQ